MHSTIFILFRWQKVDEMHLLPTQSSICMRRLSFLTKFQIDLSVQTTTTNDCRRHKMCKNSFISCCIIETIRISGSRIGSVKLTVLACIYDLRIKLNIVGKSKNELISKGKVLERKKCVYQHWNTCTCVDSFLSPDNFGEIWLELTYT